MSEIRQFVQGPDSAELFGLVGRWATSRAVHVELGAPITSEDGDLWLVEVDAGAVTGFALAHPTADAVHIRHVYSERPGVRDGLLKALLKLTNGRRVFTIGKADDALWKRSGFKFSPGRGAFGTWERA